MRQMLGFRGTASKDTSDSSTKSLSQSPQSSSPTVVAAGPVRPLRLIYCDEKGKFRIDPEAVAALQLVKGPVGVVSVSVCGQARQGKSFILNQGVLREEYKGTVQKTLAAFNASAVRVGSAQQKYEKLMQQFFKKAFEQSLL